MRSIAVTDALQNLDTTLEAVEKGEQVLLTHDGTTIARFIPARVTMAEQTSEVMARHPWPPEAVDERETGITDLRPQQDHKDHQRPGD